jgi:hypothetical protein
MSGSRMGRNPKQTERFKIKFRNPEIPKMTLFGFLVLFLIIWICFEFRISDFEFSLPDTRHLGVAYGFGFQVAHPTTLIPRP